MEENSGSKSRPLFPRLPSSLPPLALSADSKEEEGRDLGAGRPRDLSASHLGKEERETRICIRCINHGGFPPSKNNLERKK